MIATTQQRFPVTDSTSEAPYSTTDHEKHVPTTTHHTQSSEANITTTQLLRNEQTTTDPADVDVNADSSSGRQHGPGVAMTAGVSVTVVVLVLLAAAAVTAVVVYLVRKKMAPQSKGFTKLSMTNLKESDAVAV
jgi:cobalamin biosynthesis Mg chelatase CobN